MTSIDIRHGDCLEVLRDLPDNSVDSVVTDPPYGLSNTKPAQVADVLAAWVTGDTEAVPAKKGGFMGKDWDSFVPPPAVWAECLRVLKPGGHMAVFAGSRTQDLMGLSIRLAGFEIRDTLGWIYGQGFPKSATVGKSDLFCQCNKGRKNDGAESEAEHKMRHMRERNVPEAVSTSGGEGEVLQSGVSEYSAPPAGWEEFSKPEVRGGEHRMEGGSDIQEKEGELRRASVCSLSGEMEVHGKVGRVHYGAPTCDGGVDREAAPQVGGGEPYQSEPKGQSQGEFGTVSFERRSQEGGGREFCAGCRKPAPPSGLGTALKPAIEPIILARKPLDGTVAANVLAHGVGGLNIDASRVEATDSQLAEKYASVQNAPPRQNNVFGKDSRDRAGAAPHFAGRFPANVLMDEHAAAEMDQQSVGASRFFPVFKYQAKAPKKERPVIEREDGTKVQHPTVKPVALMEWLVTLITPEGGTTLDPFAGTGTTLQAARDKGFAAIGVEQDEDYIALIEQRLSA